MKKRPYKKEEEKMCKPAILNNASEVAQLLNDACFIVRREIVYSLGLFLARYIVVMTQIRREFEKFKNRKVPTDPRRGSISEPNGQSQGRISTFPWYWKY